MVAAPPVLGRHPAGRPGDRGDAAMAEPEQVLHRLMRAGRVRRRHGRDALVERHQRVDDDEAVVLVEQLLELVARLLGQDDQRPVRQAVHQPVDQRDLAVVLVHRWARGRRACPARRAPRPRRRGWPRSTRGRRAARARRRGRSGRRRGRARCGSRCSRARGSRWSRARASPARRRRGRSAPARRSRSRRPRARRSAGS